MSGSTLLYISHLYVSFRHKQFETTFFLTVTFNAFFLFILILRVLMFDVVTRLEKERLQAKFK